MMCKLNLLNPIVYFFEKIVVPPHQLMFVFLSSAAIIFLAYGPMRKFYSDEPLPQLYSVTPQQVKKWGGEPTTITVGLYIKSFPEFSFVSNQFVVNGILWFEFDSALISLDMVGKFKLDKAELLSKSEPQARLIGDKFFARYDVSIKFR